MRDWVYSTKGNFKRIASWAMLFVLAMQPVYSIVTAPVTHAASDLVTQLAFITTAQTVEANDEAELKVQLQNAAGTLEPTSSSGSKLNLSSSSPTGLFADGTAVANPWTATTNYTYNNGWTNKSFRYKDTTPGVHTITAKVSGGSIPNEVVATQTMTVTAAPVVTLTLAERIAAAETGDVIDVTEDELVTGNITINKQLTLTSSNGATITTSGSGNLFRITAAGVIVSNLHFVKTDSANQHIISVGANNTTVMGNSFSGQYDLGDSEITRALELSTASGYVISNNSFTHLRQPAYVNDSASGEITDNYVSDTRGWVVVANTNFIFTGNTFGNNATDIAIIPGSPNSYTCSVMKAIVLNNDNPAIDNQVLPIASCDTTAPSVPTNGTPHDTFSKTKEFDFTWSESTDDWPGQVKYEFRSSQDSAKVGSAPDNSGAWVSNVLNEPKIHSSGAADGVWYWQARAIDTAGNKSAWSDVWNVTIDTVGPTLVVSSPFDGDVFGGTDKIVVASYMEDAFGLGQYFIDIQSVVSTPAITTQSLDETTQQETASASLTVLAVFNAADFTNGDYVITVRVTDKAGNVSEQTRTITILHPTASPEQPGQGVVQPVDEDDDELTQLAQRLTQPFSVPRSFASSIGGSQSNEEVLGVDNGEEKEVASGVQTAAVPSEEGWKIYGVAWYWWLLLATILGVATAWILRRRGASGNV